MQVVSRFNEFNGFNCRSRGRFSEQARKVWGDIRIAGNFPPDVPTMDNFPTFPRRRRSNSVNPTTPTFLSDPEAPPPTNPVVYSPVPTINTLRGLVVPLVEAMLTEAVDLSGCIID